MSIHANLTGADLHLPFGCAAASANTVPVANGSGSLTWTTLPASIPTVLSILAAGIQTGVTAGTVQTQAGATALTQFFARVDTNATAGNGVLLPVMTAGQIAFIANATTNAVQVYGNNTATINGVTDTTGVSLAGGFCMIIVAFTGTDLRALYAA